EAVPALRVLDVLDPHIDSLGENLALNLLVYYDVHSMLGDTVDSSSFAMITLMRHSFLNSAHSLDVYNITLLTESHVSAQRNNSMFPKRPGEHIASAVPLSLGVRHFVELLKDGCCGQNV
ncbi:transcription factor 4 isoform X1, partial [Sigmodon hispidus]